MRQIKFRAWNDIDKMMIDWGLLKASPILFMNIIKGKVKHHRLIQFTGLQDKNGVDIYESMEIDGTHNVKFKNGSYVLIDISSGDIVLLHTYIESRSGNVKITREYTEI